MLNEWSLQQKHLKKQIALRAYGLRYLRRSLFVHALNEFEAQCIRRVLEDCMIRIFPNGVFPEDYEQIPDTGLSHVRFPQLGGRPYFMFLGRLHYVKGLDILAEAFADAADRIPEVDLVIVGPDAGAENDFVRRVRSAGIEHRVHRLGPLYGKSKHEALCASLALVQPSRQEGFSMAITEALAMGKPVIISETCHFPEVAEHGAGMIVPLKVRKLSRALVNCHAGYPCGSFCGCG